MRMSDSAPSYALLILLGGAAAILFVAWLAIKLLQ
jgi:hypothetical protein